MDRQSGITARTRLLGLIGHPVAHSLSPVFQNAALNALNLDFVYLSFDILPELLTYAVQSLRTMGVRGVNVTVPHKETIVPLLDELIVPGPVLGAVNAVVSDGKKLIGFNTDGEGFSKAMEQNQVEISGKTAILLGTGGAARAVVFVLIRNGIRKVVVYNRSSQRSFQFQRWADRSLAFKVEIDTWDSFINGQSPLLSSADLLINATSLGLHQEIIPIPWVKIDGCRSVIDVVYHREETPLVKEARNWGKIAFDGKLMLLYQGAKSFQIFTGMEAPLEVMEKALNEMLVG